MPQPYLELAAWLDARQLGRLQIQAVLLCTLMAVMDGFDVQGIGYVTPAILADWHLGPAAMSGAFAAGTTGLLLGALGFGWWADRAGRKAALLGCTLLFGAVTLATGFAANLTQLAVLRFIAGLGVGGALPVAVTLASECLPARIRATATMVVMCGFPLGSMLGGVLVSQVLPLYGWRAMFLVGGVVPLLLVPLAWAGLVESPRYLALHGALDALAELLRRIDPGADLPAGTAVVLDEPPPAHHGLAALFRGGMALPTLLLWTTFFMVLVDIGVVMQWMPTVLHGTGFSLRAAVLITTLVQLGALVASLLMGRLIDRVGFLPVLVPNFLLAAAALVLLGRAGNSALITGIAALLAGATVVGGQSAVGLLAAASYSTALRGTGVGWAYGIGRLGTVVGPVAAGFLLQWQWDRPAFFAAAAVPAFLAGLAVLAQRRAGQAPAAALLAQPQ